MSKVESPTLRRVLAGELCSGCGLCAGVSGGAVALETVAPGYTRPRQVAPVAPEAESKFAAACPGSVVAAWEPAPEADIYWGPYREVLTGHAVDPEVRFEASSGGVLSALAIHALDDRVVDAVVHVRADPERPTRNLIAISTDRADVLGGAGSRYAASSPLATIDALLNDGRRFAFIGKPCDVSALRQLALLDLRVDRAIPLKLSFFCGGIPSHAGADRILRTMGLEPDNVVRFRYRGQGWPGRTVAETADGAIGDMSYADSWGGHLSKEVQFRCKVCPDAVGGVADIAAADAWHGGESGYPQFEEQDGRSLIVVRSAVGAELVRRCRATGAVETKPLDVRQIDLMQPSQANRKRSVAARTAAARTTMQPVPRMTGLSVNAASRRSSWRSWLRNYLGTARRIIQGRR